QEFVLTLNPSAISATEQVSVPIGIPAPIPGVAVNIPQGTEISVPMDVHFSAVVEVRTASGPVESRDFESEDGLLEGSMFVTLPPNTAFTVTEKYDGQAVPDTIFPLPTYDFGLPNRQNEFNTGSSTENIIYQINLRAELSDLLTMVLGDFNGTARIKETLTDVVNLELTATKLIPANTDINFASGFTIDLSRSMQVERFVPCTLSVDLDTSTDVYVDEAISKGLNQTISVAIVVTDAEDLDSYSFTLKYAPGKMRLIPGSIQQGGFLGDTAYFIPSVDQENGRISISQSRFNSEADFGQSGNGRLAVLEFEIVDAGQIDLSIDPTDAVVFNSARDQFSPLLEDATITVYRPDPTVNLQIEHQVVGSRTEYAGFLADPTTQILPDDIIKIKVTADYLTNLDSYDLNLSYNTNILEPVTDGEALLFFDETGSVISTANQDENTFTIYTIDQNTGQVQVSRSISGSDPIGAPDGFFQLFELRLKAIQGGVGKVKLDQLQLIDVQNRIDRPSLATATERVLVSVPVQSSVGQMVTFALDNGLDNILVEIDIPKEHGILKTELDVISDSGIPAPFSARADIGTALRVYFIDNSGNPVTTFGASFPLAIRIPFDPTSSTDTIVLADSNGEKFLPTTIVNGNALEAELTHLSDIFTLSNHAPAVSTALGTLTVDEDADDYTIDLTNYFTDADLNYGDALTYQVQVADPDSILSVDDSQLPDVTLAFLGDKNGDTANLTVTVTDVMGETVTDRLDVSVTSSNDAPIFTLSDTEIKLDEDFTDSQTITVLQGAVPADETDQYVAYETVPVDLSFADLVIDPQTGEITITAKLNQYGTQDITVRAVEYETGNGALPNN
ncbi:MAG: cohesin domain-containing protein, partial [Candidatus Poribacteria bacterium]|nr:cohesin domain-containing protein [Candidatus Poribacteria bacterium]